MKWVPFSFRLFWVLALSAQAAFSAIVTPQGQPLPEVVEIFNLFKHKLKHPQYLRNPTLENLKLLSQQDFLRPHRSERLSDDAIAHYKNLVTGMTDLDQKKVISLFQKLGDIDDVFPPVKEFDYILINGSTVKSMRERIMFFAHALERKKVKLKPDTKIIFLEGERKLFPSETRDILLNPFPYILSDGWKAPSSLPKDERDAAVMVWDQLRLPAQLRESKYYPIFVHAKKKVGANRAETEDCVKEWITVYPPKKLHGAALVVSNNPFVYYQQLVTERLLAQLNFSQIKLYGLGSALSKEFYPDVTIQIGVLLDTLARNLNYYSSK